MLRQSTYIFVANVVGYGIRILLPAFLVRALTKADFGAYNQFFLLEVLFKTIFQMGVSQSQYFFVPKDQENAGGYFVNSLLLNFGLFAVAYTLIGVFRYPLGDFLKMSVLTELFWHLAAYSLLLMLQVCASTYLMARKLFKQAAILEVANQVAFTVASLVAAFATRDLRTVITTLVVARAVSLTFIVLYIHLRIHGFRSERYFFGLGEQVRYGVVLGVSGMLWTFLMRMHELAVSKFFPLETYAVYAAGCKQIPVLQFFTQAIAPVALVKFAQLEAEGKWEEMQKFWNKILGMMYGFGIPVTLFFIVIAKPLVTLMFTSAYGAAIPVFQLAAVAQLYQLFNPGRVLRAIDRNDVSVKVHLAMFILLPAALWVGKSVAGMYGIIAAHAIVAITARVVAQVILNRITPASFAYVPPWADVWTFYRESWGKVVAYAGRLRP